MKKLLRLDSFQRRVRDCNHIGKGIGSFSFSFLFFDLMEICFQGVYDLERHLQPKV